MSSLAPIIAPSAFRMHIGKRCQILPVPPSCDHVRTGIIKFSGNTSFSDGPWVGCELDPEWEGKNNGTVAGVEYFKTSFGTTQGIFVRPELVQLMPDAGLVAVELRSELQALAAKLTESEKRVEELQIELEITREEKLMVQDEIELLRKRIEIGAAAAATSVSSSGSAPDSASVAAAAASEAVAVKVQHLEAKLAQEVATSQKLRAALKETSEQLEAERKDSTLLQAVMDSKLDLEAAVEKTEAEKRKLRESLAELEQLCQMQAEELVGQQRQLAEMSRVHSVRLQAANEALLAARESRAALRQRAAAAEETVSALSKNDQEKQMLLAASSAVVAAAKRAAAQAEKERVVSQQVFDIIIPAAGTNNRDWSATVLRHFVQRNDEDENNDAGVKELTEACSLIDERMSALTAAAVARSLICLAARTSATFCAASSALLFLVSFRIGFLQRPDSASSSASFCHRLVSASRDVVLAVSAATSAEDVRRILSTEDKLGPLLQLISPSPSSEYLPLDCMNSLRECMSALLQECAQVASQLRDDQQATSASGNTGSDRSLIAEFIITCREARLPDEVAVSSSSSSSCSSSSLSARFLDLRGIHGISAAATELEAELAQSVVNLCCVLRTLQQHAIVNPPHVATVEQEHGSHAAAQLRHSAVWLQAMDMDSFTAVLFFKPALARLFSGGGTSTVVSSSPPSGVTAAAIVKASVANLCRTWLQLKCDEVAATAATAGDLARVIFASLPASLRGEQKQVRLVLTTADATAAAPAHKKAGSPAKPSSSAEQLGNGGDCAHAKQHAEQQLQLQQQRNVLLEKELAAERARREQCEQKLKAAEHDSSKALAVLEQRLSTAKAELRAATAALASRKQ